jgi:hypothetical protein
MCACYKGQVSGEYVFVHVVGGRYLFKYLHYIMYILSQVLYVSYVIKNKFSMYIFLTIEHVYFKISIFISV